MHIFNQFSLCVLVTTVGWEKIKPFNILSQANLSFISKAVTLSLSVLFQVRSTSWKLEIPLLFTEPLNLKIQLMNFLTSTLSQNSSHLGAIASFMSLKRVH